MSSVPIRVSVTFSSDWQIGSGAGIPGSLDSVARRDPRTNLPFIPAKTLTGILRDACESIAAGLDGPAGSGWAASVAALFGDQPARDQGGSLPPAAARLALRPAVFVDPLADRLSREPELIAALTFAKSGVEISQKTEAAREKSLRMDEVVRGGCTLIADGTIDETGLGAESVDGLRALLWAGATIVKRLGGDRRRGHGRCTVVLSVHNGRSAGPSQHVALIKRLKGDAPRDKGLRKQAAGMTLPKIETASGTGEWHRLFLKLVLDSPVVVPAGVQGNVVRSLDYVPGSQLLGSLAGCLSPKGLLNAAIARGDFQVLNAYLEVGAERGLPIPLSLVHDKETGGLDSCGSTEPHVANLLATADAGLTFRPHRGGYVGETAGDTLPPCGRVELSTTTHNTINDEKQRPISDEGGVFSYEAIPVGTVLRTEVRCRETIWRTLAKADCDAMNGRSITIGIAKKDDYGRVRVQVVPTSAGSSAADSGTGSRQSSLVTVLLASDLLVRGRSLRPSADPKDVADAIADALRKTVPDVKVTWSADHVYARTRRTDGWQTRWHRPRPTYVGLRAGSVMQFTISASQSTALGDALRQLALSGLGERRAEGFGELRIDVPMLTMPFAALRRRSDGSGEAGDARRSPLPAIRQAGDKAAFTFGRLLEQAAWRRAIHRSALTWASDTDGRRATLGWTPKLPRNAQLGALRSLIRELDESSSDLVEAWAEGAEGTKSGSGAPVLALVENHELIWHWLSAAAAPVITERAEIDLKKELWTISVRALLLASVQAEQRTRENEATIAASTHQEVTS